MKTLARASQGESAIARRIGTMLLSCFVAAWAAGGATARPDVNRGRASDQISAHQLTNSSGDMILTWTAAHNARAIAFEGSTDVADVLGDTLSFWSGGALHERIRYHSGGLWRTRRIRFGVTRSELGRALHHGAIMRIASPLRRLGGGAGAPPSTVT